MTTAFAFSNSRGLDFLDDAPNSPITGQAYFDSNDNKIKVYDGSQWQDIADLPETRPDWEFLQEGPEVWVIEIHNIAWGVAHQPGLEDWVNSSPPNSFMNTHDSRLLLFLYSEEDVTYFKLRFAE